MQKEVVNKQNKKEYLIKRNDCIKKEFNSFNLKKKNIKLNKNIYKNHIIEVVLFVILDITFFSTRTLENKRKTSTIYTITYTLEGSGNSPIIGDNSNLPNKLKVNGEEINSINQYFGFNSDINIVELQWNNQPKCQNMFQYMEKLKTIDLSDFDSTGITDMSKMFYFCQNLEKINFGNYFNTESVESMHEMFYGCEKVKTLDLSMFKTLSLKNMRDMFFKMKSLVSLDLSNFNISSVTNFQNLIYDSNDLVYLNMRSFEEKDDNLEVSNFFSPNTRNLVYCIDPSKAPIIYGTITQNDINHQWRNNCSDDCFTLQKPVKVIQELKKCIDDCTNDGTYIYEQDNICYDHNPNNDDNESSEDTTEETSDSSEDTSEETSESSEDTSEETSESSEESSENNSEESSEERVEDSPEQSPEESDEKSSEETHEDTEQLESTADITENDITNITEKFDGETFFKISQHTADEELENKDEVIKSLKEDIISGNLNTLLSELVNGTKEDLIAEYKDITYQLTTTANQKDNSYNNISTIDLGDCEDILRGIYGIDKNLSLIILKIDYKMEGLLIPVIGYEVYHPENKSLLNLSYCNETTIKLNIPVSIDEDEVDKYDPNSGYYNDDCYAYTTENGTDIILNDRKNEYVDNNLSLCENDCTFNGYDSDTKKAKCECYTKVEINYISDIISDENILSNNFNLSENSKTNLGAMKCVSLLFSKNGLIKNIGSYIIFFVLVLFAAAIFFFYKCGHQLIEDNIREILDLKLNKKTNIDIFNVDSSVKNIRKKKRNKSINKKKGLANPHKKNNNKKKKKQMNIGGGVDQFIPASKSDLKNTRSLINNEKHFGDIKIKKIEKIANTNKFKESELNFLNYKDAIIYDKRAFSEYYNCLNKIKISILFAFYPLDDYNIKIIKICIFFLSFVIYFSVNTFFFNDDTFHQIYLDGGKYNFLYFLPQIIYSFVICHLINNVLKYFCLSERDYLQIKNEENEDAIKDKADSTKRFLIIKYIIFFIASFIFLIVFWYYLSSFCAVYQNTQIYLLINTFISFLISSLFPLIFNVVPSVFRINSLKNKHNECFYSTSKFFQIL